jgi:exodeoxyribonuclease-3
MRIISWNVNGLRAALSKGFIDFVNEYNPDTICIQETKMQKGQATVDLADYEEFWNSAEKKGYSGTAIFTKIKPISVSYNIGKEEHNYEGRVITLEYEKYYLINVYTPNSQEKLARIDYRMKWEEDFLEYINNLDKNKPVIICGDLNVAHKEIDLKNPKSNAGNAGFSPQERDKISKLLDSGFVDTFRYLYPDAIEKYTWWSYRFNARVNNAGWRIDYFIVSEKLKENVIDSKIFQDVMGSDHCPICLDIDKI